jgi:hypothetical protein
MVSRDEMERAYFEQFQALDDDPYAYLQSVDRFPLPWEWYRIISLEEWEVLYTQWKRYHPDAP